VEDSDLYRRLHAELERRLETLPDKPDENADRALRTLWHMAAGNPLSLEQATHRPLPPLSADGERTLAALVEQRLSGTPLAHITGRQRFLDVELLASPSALIPRRETELVGRAALGALQGIPGGGPLRVIDVCTGSGNLAVALAVHEPRARVFAADLSADAVVLARENARFAGVADRVDVREGDLLAPFSGAEFQGTTHLVVCNPPYISSAKVETMPAEISAHEPRLAFDGGALGVRILQRLIREAPPFLRADGWLAFEVGLGQGPAVLKRLESQGTFTDARALTNETGDIRAIIARNRAP